MYLEVLVGEGINGLVGIRLKSELNYKVVLGVLFVFMDGLEVEFVGRVDLMVGFIIFVLNGIVFLDLNEFYGFCSIMDLFMKWLSELKVLSFEFECGEMLCNLLDKFLKILKIFVVVSSELKDFLSFGFGFFGLEFGSCVEF